MNTTEANTATKIKVGLFTVLALILIGVVTVYVNDKPFWWRSCQLVHINVEDATGLKTKSPIRSLGLQIGYLKTIELTETYVRLGICITAEVEVLPSTRAYIRGEGFLGDKFVELKPVKYVGPKPEEEEGSLSPKPANQGKSGAIQQIRTIFLGLFRAFLIPEALAEPSPAPRQATEREIPVGERSQDVQQLMEQVEGLVSEMTSLTNNLKEAIRPEELRVTLNRLNQTLEHASRTLSPEGRLNVTAQRTLEKLEDAIEQLRAQMTRINQGQGSLGMFLNDSSYAEELRQALRSVNMLLGKASTIRFVVDMGAEQIKAYDGGRGWFRLGIWPAHDRYYLIGVSSDPRGRRTVETVTTTSGSLSNVTAIVREEPGAILLTGMIGKLFSRRLDLSGGALHSDGVVSVALWLGPHDREEMIIARNDVYSRGQGIGIDDRVSLTVRPLINSKVFGGVYFKTGFDSLRKTSGSQAFFYGAGVTFDDEDIKLLFALR